MEICALTGEVCADSPLVRFETAGRKWKGRRRWNDQEEISVQGAHFVVYWSPARTHAVADQAYRISVSLHGVRLGYADVLVTAGRHQSRGALLPVNLHETLPIRFFIERGVVGFGSATIDENGGTLEVGDVRLDVPAGALAGPQPVEMLLGSTEETRKDYEASSAAYGMGPMAEGEVRIRVGTTAPVAPLRITLPVPDGFPDSTGLEAVPLALVWQDGGQEILDTFEPLSASVDEDGALVAELPPYAFTDRRRPDAGFEAVIVLGSATASTGTASLVSNAAASTFGTTLQAAQTCAAPHFIGPPLAPPLVKTGDFSATAPVHLGVDLRAADGDSVRAVADGKVEHIGWDERPLDHPDPRSGKMVKGWGRYVVIRHNDGWFSLYAHLDSSSTDGLNAGDTMSAGQQIALADNTGGSTAPHLHLEYMSGWGTTNRNQIDPWPCISVVDSVAVVPHNASVRVGATVQLGATAFDAEGQTVKDAPFTWSSSNTALATVDTAGLVTAVAVGTAYIVASSGPAADSATVQIQATHNSYDGYWYFTVPPPDTDPPQQNWYSSEMLYIQGSYVYEAYYVPELGTWVSAAVLQIVDMWDGYLYAFAAGRRIKFNGPMSAESLPGTYEYYIQYQPYTVNVTFTRGNAP